MKKGDKVAFVNHDLVTHDLTEETKKPGIHHPWQLIRPKFRLLMKAPVISVVFTL